MTAAAAHGLILRLVSSYGRLTERKRRATYPEFQGGGRGVAASSFSLQKLAAAGGRRRRLSCSGSPVAGLSPAPRRSAVAAAYARRWGQMLAIAAQTAFASSPCELPIDSALAVYASGEKKLAFASQTAVCEGCPATESCTNAFSANCAPFQYAILARAGAEALARGLRAVMLGDRSEH